jgi:hypothetical protein
MGAVRKKIHGTFYSLVWQNIASLSSYIIHFGSSPQGTELAGTQFEYTNGQSKHTRSNII